MLTVSSGTWKSTITRPPLTITEWGFKQVTITAGAGVKKREALGSFYPAPATTSSWPAVVYTGPNGSPTTIAPTVTVPKPPASIGPNAPPPPEGSWPTVAMLAVQGLVASLLVDECSYYGEGCELDLLTYKPAADPDGGDDDGGAHFLDEENYCPAETSSTSTLPPPKPTASPMAQPLSEENHVRCIDRGESVDHDILDNFSDQFCDIVQIRSPEWERRLPDELFSMKYKFFITPYFSVNFFFLAFR